MLTWNGNLNGNSFLLELENKKRCNNVSRLSRADLTKDYLIEWLKLYIKLSISTNKRSI